MIVLDTSFIVAWHNSRDVHHAAARALEEDLRSETWGRALLPEYVFVEVTTVLAARRNLATAIVVGDMLLRSREVEFMPCSDLFDETFTVFRSQSSVGLSFTDASIVAVARRYGAEFVATFDEGFLRVDGLDVVPGPRPTGA